MILLLGPQYGSDVSRMAINKMRKMVGYDFHYMRKKYRVLACRALFARGGGFCSSMWRRQDLDGTQSRSK